MPETVLITLTPSQAADPQTVERALAARMGRVPVHGRYRVVRRSIDARRGRVRVQITVRVFADDESVSVDEPRFTYRDVHGAPPVIVVGAGPAGLFAAMRLVERGLKPIVVERGRAVEARRRDVAALNRRGLLNNESNYAFGEGGAGTFSDGKLYTRSKKRGDHRRVLYRLVQHGADEGILIDAHPHIGSNRLPAIVTAMRATIEAHGGEVGFAQRVVRLAVSAGRVAGVILADGTRIDGRAVVLATGHSADDVYAMLMDQGIRVEPKAFAMGVRVEHPQRLIDRIQYHGQDRGAFLPAASYRLVHQAAGRGVYSFCMCPGGVVVPASTHVGGLVVNGMSFAKRNSPYANAGIVVEIDIGDVPGRETKGPLAGLAYQRSLEAMAWANGGGGMIAPAQRLEDFVHGRPSLDLPPCSYPPGVTPSPLHQWLPASIRRRLQAALQAFDRQMNGFVTNDAVVVGVESRTSSPVRIPRDSRSLQHPAVQGLFPCGEGAGYAGGIVSCAVDGERIADAVDRYLNPE